MRTCSILAGSQTHRALRGRAGLSLQLHVRTLALSRIVPSADVSDGCVHGGCRSGDYGSPGGLLTDETPLPIREDELPQPAAERPSGRSTL